MDHAATTAPAATYRTPPLLWALALVSIAIVLYVAREGFGLVTDAWLNKPEYSHGILIPPIVAWLIWQRRRELAKLEFRGSWLGVAVVLLGLGLWLAGNLSTIYAVSQYALVVMIYGIVLSFAGPTVFARIWIPLLMLLFTIPLPNFLYNNLSSQLQLVSSSIGVGFMRLCGISVYLAGNVIDLGHFQMQVVEACDGLRYLFPLMTLGFIVAYFFRAPLWMRALVFLSSIPITVCMNSFRIAMIGLFAEFGNTSLAEGLLHDLQGWVIFMISAAVLLFETWLLTRFCMRGRSWHSVLAFDMGEPVEPVTPGSPRRKLPAALVVSLGVLVAATLDSVALPERVEARPSRSWFIDFPLQIGEWRGQHGRLEDIYIDALQFDDYIMADFTSASGSGDAVINFYAAYYGSQRSGASIHSPRSCIPGGGWRITDFGQIDIPASSEAESFRVNRALIELGGNRQLVYYWFKQRERVITNEYAAKWYIFQDALTRSRTDGALMRLVAPLPRGESLAAADARLTAFATEIQARIEPYVPD